MNKYEDGDFLLSPAAFLRILQQISVRNLAKVVLTAAGPPKSVTTNLAAEVSLWDKMKTFKGPWTNGALEGGPRGKDQHIQNGEKVVLLELWRSSDSQASQAWQVWPEWQNTEHRASSRPLCLGLALHKRMLSQHFLSACDLGERIRWKDIFKVYAIDLDPGMASLTSEGKVNPPEGGYGFYSRRKPVLLVRDPGTRAADWFKETSKQQWHWMCVWNRPKAAGYHLKVVLKVSRWSNLLSLILFMINPLH